MPLVADVHNASVILMVIYTVNSDTAACLAAFFVSYRTTNTDMFQIVKQTLILDKDNQTKCKMQFLIDDFIY